MVAKGIEILLKCGISRMSRFLHAGLKPFTGKSFKKSTNSLSI